MSVLPSLDSCARLEEDWLYIIRMQREFPVCMGSKAVSLSAWPSLNLEDVETEIKQQKLMEEKQVINLK